MSSMAHNSRDDLYKNICPEMLEPLEGAPATTVGLQLWLQK
jgi:hypothetical protein